MSNLDRRVLDRVEGVFVIGNTVLPIALAVLVVWGAACAWAALENSLIAYKASLAEVVKAANLAKQELQHIARDVLKTTEHVQEEGKKAADSINRVTTKFGRALDGFGDAFAQPVPDFMKSGMRALGNSLAVPFRPLSDEFKKVGGSIRTIKTELASVAAKVAELERLKVYFDAVIAEYDRIHQEVDKFIAMVGKTLRTLAYFMLALALWWATGYFLWLRSRLRHGLALIRGRA